MPSTAPAEVDETALRTDTPQRHTLPHVAALDGIRALAVSAVLVYHLGLGFLPGGFLGVDVFFVLSGYLITTLLLNERLNDGSVSLTRFYFRRARRLLPALYVLLVTVAAYCVLVLPEELERLRGDVVAAFFYVTNWYLIVNQESYFEALGRPDLLRHLWSLAVEEQFYLLWPLLLALMLGRARRVRIVGALRWTVALILGSTLLMAVLYDPFADPSRVYYGTDTRAAALLVGAAMAMVWRPWSAAGRAAPNAARALDLMGWVALVGLLLLLVVAHDTSPWMYRGGFLVVAVASAVLIAVVVHPSAATVPRVFGTTALVWIGMRSYAIYLWHWPVFMVTRPEDVPLDGAALAVFRVAVTVALAALSFRFVEDPVRRGALGRWWRGLDPDISPVPGRHLGRESVVAAGTALLVGLAFVGLATARPVEAANVAVDRGPAPEVSLSEAPRPSGQTSASPTSPTEGVAPVQGRPFNRPIRTGMFGDSTGMTLVLNEPAGLGRYLKVSDQTVEGCSVIEGRISSRTGFRRDLSADCGNWEQRWEQKAAALKPQIALVNLGAWDVFDIDLDGDRMPFGSPTWDAYFTAQLEKGVAILAASGAQVALSEVPCFRPVAAGGLPKLPERGMDDRTRHLNQLMAAVAAQHPGRVFLVSPPEEFCADKEIATNLSYRWDGTHYYKPGAKLYFDVVTPQLLKIPRPS